MNEKVLKMVYILSVCFGCMFSSFVSDLLEGCECAEGLWRMSVVGA